MKHFILAAVLAFSSLAHAADDAPLVDQQPPLVPAQTCVPDTQRIKEGKAMASCLARVESLEKGNVIIPTPAFIGGAAGLVVLSVVLTFVVVKVAEPKP